MYLTWSPVPCWICGSWSVGLFFHCVPVIHHFVSLPLHVLSVHCHPFHVSFVSHPSCMSAMLVCFGFVWLLAVGVAWESPLVPMPLCGCGFGFIWVSSQWSDLDLYQCLISLVLCAWEFLWLSQWECPMHGESVGAAWYKFSPVQWLDELTHAIKLTGLWEIRLC